MLWTSSSRALSAALVASTLLAASAAEAADQSAATADQTYGTTASPAVSASDIAAMQGQASGLVATANNFTAAQYATAGGGLRNRGSVAFSISGVVTPVKAAFLYWAVIDNGPAKPGESTVKLKRLSPGPTQMADLTGTVVGKGPSPCWGGTAIVVYKAPVPTALASDNGSYEVVLSPGAVGLTDGSDPFVGPVKFPLWDGASLVMVGTGAKRVTLFDTGLAGATFKTSLRYSLQLPAVASSPVLFDSIGADGQIGSGRKAVRGLPGKTTTINGYFVAGPRSFRGDSDWDGLSAQPLPQLWDDAGHDITPAAQGLRTLNVAITPENGPVSDCATPIANVVQY